MPRSRWQYQTKAEPLNEHVNIDKWYSKSQDPVRVKQATAAILSMPFAFIQVESSDSISGGGPKRIRRIRKKGTRWQYQSKAEPVGFNSPNEEIFLDKWFFWHPDPVRPNEFTNPIFSPTHFMVLDSSQISPPSGLELWTPILPIPRYDIPRQEFLYESYVNDPSIFLAGPLPDKWFIQVTEPVQVPENLGYITIGDLILDSSQIQEQTDVGKWGYPQSIPIFDKERNQYAYEYFFVDVDITPAPSEDVTLDKWYFQQNGRLSHKLGIPYITVGNIDLSDNLFSEPITLDKWEQQISQPLFDKRRNQYIYQSFFIDPEILTQIETTTIDKWFIRSEFVIPPRKRTPHLYGYFWSNPETFATRLVFQANRLKLIFDSRRVRFYGDGND